VEDPQHHVRQLLHATAPCLASATAARLGGRPLLTTSPGGACEASSWWRRTPTWHFVRAADIGWLLELTAPRVRPVVARQFADRVPGAVRLDRDEALGELALRYFTGHGPATLRDLSYWATLTVTDVRRGAARVRDRLESFEEDGLTFWHAPDEAPGSSQEPGGHLLQILDETYRGYSESRMVLDAEGVVPTGRETAIGMALVDAQMVARMKRTVGKRVVFELSPYRATLRADELEALEEAAARYGALLGLEHELVVGPGT
jgi:Winged helix DNA-binding domain